MVNKLQGILDAANSAANRIGSSLNQRRKLVGGEDFASSALALQNEGMSSHGLSKSTAVKETANMNSKSP